MLTLLAIVLSLLISIYVWKDRKNIERLSVLFVRRTKKGIWLLDKIAKIPGLRAVYTFAIPIAFIGSILILLLILLNSYFILKVPSAGPGIAPVIPGVRIPGSPIFIPFWDGIIALAILLFVHEGSHGIAMRLDKIKVKSTGLLLALVIPGAFVEPDKKNFERARPLSRLRVAGAGSFANMVTAVVCVLLAMSLLGGVPLRGAVLVSVLNETPAGDAFNQSTVISAVNGYPVYSFSEMAEILNKTKPNETVIFETVRMENGTPMREEVSITATEFPGNRTCGYIGIPMIGVVTPSTKSFLVSLPLQPMFMVKYLSYEYWELSPAHWKWNLISLLKWTAFLNFAIGLVNLLPVLPLDGGLIIQEIVKKIRPKAEKKFMLAMGWLIMLLFLINILPYFL